MGPRLWLIAHLALVAARGEYETSGRSLLQAHFKAKALQEHAKEHAKELPELETLADLVVKKVVTRLEPPKLRAKPLNLDQLSPTCRARPAPPARLAQDNASSSRSERGSCAQNEFKLLNFQTTGVTSTCCKSWGAECAGCARVAGRTCKKCQGGFIMRDRKCVSCASSSDWLSLSGLSCMQISQSDCNDVKVRSQSSNEACCICSGGHLTPTPFEYPLKRWSLTSDIVMRPEPRTASRYTVDESCELGAHNLTISGVSGRVSWISGKEKPKEGFNFQCEVTAHQAVGVSLTAVVTLAADALSYPYATLLFHGSETVSPLTAGTGWSHFAMSCAPPLEWLSINKDTGVLSSLSSSSSGGVSVAEDFYGQDGAVCSVTGWQKVQDEMKQHSTSFVALKPRCWSSLSYPLSSMRVSLGQELPPLKPTVPSGQGLMKPFTYDMACTVNGASFHFDRILHMGFVDGHSVLELDLDGQLLVAPASTLTELFDRSTQDVSRKKLDMQCRIFGLFPDESLPPVETSMAIMIEDSICWVTKSIKGIASMRYSASSVSKCRSDCRESATCAYYAFSSSTCAIYDLREDGQRVTVQAKVTNCTEGTCMQVEHNDWYLAGTYCPLGVDSLKGGMMYAREHVTPQDVVYLYAARISDGCNAPKWVLQKVDSQDYVDKAKGIFEFKGATLACLDESAVDFALKKCPAAPLAWEQEEEEGLSKLVLDDPGTSDVADYWLHPCDCAPPAWTNEPVNAEDFENMPADSRNDFIPSPYSVVSGQFVCPSRQLVDDGIHFQTEEELQEPSDCATRCRNNVECKFFWHGSQHGAATCRLFSGCDTLVREFSLEGELKVMARSKSCQVADAEACWATSLRRSFLGMSYDPAGTSSATPTTPVETVPPKPADPPADGMVSWFKSEHAGTFWPSSVGNFVGVGWPRSVVRATEAGFGADRPVTMVKGRDFQGMDFGKVIKKKFTICSVTRYDGIPGEGTKRGRILDVKEYNWFHGHWNNNAGVAHYEQWVTTHEHGDHLKNSLDWVVACGTNMAQVFYLGHINIARPDATYPKELASDATLTINNGMHSGESSMFAAMEIITWDRGLSAEEMLQTTQYLQWKLKAGAVLETNEHLATFREQNFIAMGNKALNDLIHNTYDMPLANGYSARLTGWTHTRDYAHGFLRNTNGKAKAVVSGLQPSAEYLYAVYNPTTLGIYHHWSLRVYLNGIEAGWSQDGYDIATVNGIATADANGEMTFEFERNGHSHIHLGGIALAKLGAHTAVKPSEPPSNGMVSWFKSENAGSIWPSSVGDFYGRSQTRGIMRESNSGYGADKPVTYIRGSAKMKFSFGKVLPNEYSICSVTRYWGTQGIGEACGRILQTAESNFIHGHWSCQAGAAFYDRWVTPRDEKNQHSQEWVVLCGTNMAKRVYKGDQMVGTDIGKKVGEQTLVINTGKYHSEVSAFAVMEVITWNRELGDAEMQQAVAYLKWKLRAGAFLETSEHLTNFQENNFIGEFGQQGLSDVQHQTFTAAIGNGYQARLSGWTHTRAYAGFLRNLNGKALAVVSGLTPAAQYLYSIYCRDTSHSWYGHNLLLTVNGGMDTVFTQDAFDIAVAQGLATANPRGEISFEFDRNGNHHVHLSGIAVAAMASPFAVLQSKVERTSTMESGFHNLHLYQQCDTILLLGGMGVQQCGRPKYRSVDSHAWKHKKPMPNSFQHGSLLLASCWAERYKLFRGASLVSNDRLQCVNGRWYNSLGQLNLQGLSCESCVQVGVNGYAAYDSRNEQELYHFNRMALSVYTELGMMRELSQQPKHKHCLEPADQGTSMTVVASSSCNANLIPQVSSLTNPLSRRMRIIPEDLSLGDQCLTARSDGKAGLNFKKCEDDDDTQLISPAEIPSDVWALHVEADERTQDLHTAYSSYCGTSGALSNLDFGQIFVGDTLNIKTRCKFAPLVQFGTFLETGIVRDRTSTNWPDWHKQLADYPVECNEGEGLTAFKLDSGLQKFKYECSKIGGVGACFDYYSAQVEVPSFHQAKQHWSEPMRMLQANCGENSVLGGFHFEFSEGGKWQRVRYRCCKAGGAPVTMDPRGQVPDLVSPMDGVYCPTLRDDSGRFQYAAGSQVLKFDRTVGKWCLGTDCSDVTDQASPVAAPGAPFDVVNVSDFDGEFVGAGVPGQHSNAALALEDALKLKPPKRPPQPPMPELEEFEAQQPKYAAECLDYENLWKEVSETYKNEEDEEVQTSEKLEADLATKEASLPDYHPCEVARGAGGIFGHYGGGDGSTAPENMMYSDWNDCMQGDIERDLVSATFGYHDAMSEFIMDMIEEGMGVICSVIPDTMIAPFGAGIALNPGEICDSAAELVGAVKKFAGPASAFHFAKKGFEVEQEGYAACNPLQIGFARVFCDVHCVRDAVIRGDRSIIRNLELATKKTNNNLQKMVKWSVDAARTETGFLSDKLDFMHAVNTAYLANINQLLTPAGGSLVHVQKATDDMFKELEGFALGASFDQLSKLTARDAIENFLQSEDVSDRPNATAAAAFVGRLESMGQTLRRVGDRDRTQLLARQMERQVKYLQRRAKRELNTLGVYRLESVASAKHRRHLASLVGTIANADRIWWQLRVKLDEYLEVAEEEVNAFQKSIDDMASFQGCATVFSSLISSYSHSMSLMTRSHRKLRSTWREASALLGELSSVLVDTDAFENFLEDRGKEGCKEEGFMEQTMKQVHSAVWGLGFLRHRFAAAGMSPPPSGAAEALGRLVEAHRAARKRCA